MVEIVLICLNSRGDDRDLFGLCAFRRQEWLVSASNVFRVHRSSYRARTGRNYTERPFDLGKHVGFFISCLHRKQLHLLCLLSKAAVYKEEGNVSFSLLFLFIIARFAFFCAFHIPMLCTIVSVILFPRRHWLHMRLIFFSIRGSLVGSLVWTCNNGIDAEKAWRPVRSNFCSGQILGM